MTAISASIPDWSRELKRPFEWEPPRALLASIRAYQRASSRSPFAILRRWIAMLRHRFWSLVTGADIPLNCNIGGGLHLPLPNGVVIHPGTRIGPNCLILPQVTIGAGPGGAPTIGGHVDIGIGARILGGVTVGDHARIGAGAVVIHDVPAGVTVAGDPARPVPERPDDLIDALAQAL